MQEYVFIDKALYLREKEILVFGDMHLGHEFTYRQSGSQIPKTQVEETSKSITKIFNKLKKLNLKVEKVIFLGDIKHFFSYQKGEKNIILEILLLIGKHVKRENIILIKGNHEKMAEIADKKLIPFYKEKDVAFVHGDELEKKAFVKDINTIIMGHLHPAVTISDEQGIKSEKYKCFLVGKYKNKNIIILPSFLPSVEGTSVNLRLSDSHCFIPKKTLVNFKAFVIGEKEVLDFGKVKDL